MFCPSCGKVGYATQAIAKASLRHIKTRRRRRAKTPARAYYSEACGCWHLTSHT